MKANICEQCDRPTHARGLCKSHYGYAIKKGLIKIIQPQSGHGISVKDRLEKHSNPSATSDCILWTGRTDIGGYGRICINGADQPAHRASWELKNQRPVGSMRVLHKCDVRNCINPEHLFLGTDADNVADKCKKGRQARGERNGAAKLNDEKVRKIRSDGRFLWKIAADYGVSQETIRRIKIGRIWKYCL